MGSAVGAAKTAAARIGMSLQDYQKQVSAGRKWCTGCKAWHPVAAFPRDRTRGDGRKAKCLAADRGKPRFPRDPEHEAARRAVSYAVRTGRIRRPVDLTCTDCGHRGHDRRHEYDHFLGYEIKNHLDVEAVCTTCHADRERRRRNGRPIQD